MPWSRCGQGEGADPPGDASGPQGAGAARLGQWRTGGSRPARGRTQLKAGPLHTAPLPTGALLLADPGCWSLARPRTLATTGASWLRRLDLHTHVVTPEGMRLDLPRWLDTAGTVPVTNVPAERLSLPKAVVLSRARWHVALLFKLWKQHGQMEQSRSRDPWRVLSELNGTLIALVTQYWVLLLGCWRRPDRSLVRPAQPVRAHALGLLQALGHAAQRHLALAALATCLAVGCPIGNRRRRPSAFQRWLDPSLAGFARCLVGDAGVARAPGWMWRGDERGWAEGARHQQTAVLRNWCRSRNCARESRKGY